MEERFDLIVIGGGPGGHAAAETAARLDAASTLSALRELLDAVTTLRRVA